MLRYSQEQCGGHIILAATAVRTARAPPLPFPPATPKSATTPHQGHASCNYFFNPTLPSHSKPPAHPFPPSRKDPSKPARAMLANQPARR